MSITTLGGLVNGQTTTGGALQVTSGSPLAASDLVAGLTDAAGIARQCLRAGVLAGAIPTASGLTVTIPHGTVYVAGAVWTISGGSNVVVPDASTTYIWGCADGALRTTSTTTPPTGYDATTACILCKVVASGGNSTVTMTDRPFILGSPEAPVGLAVSTISGARSDADITATQQEYAGQVVELTFSGWTAARNLILPLYRGMRRHVVNATGYAVTVKGSSGTGVTIASARSATVYCDGTKWVRLTADTALT